MKDVKRMKLTKEMTSWYGLVATVGTVGRFSKMPGTLGSIVGTIILLAFGGVAWWAILAVTVFGTICADIYAKKIGVTDPAECVIDEVAGVWLASFALPLNYAIIALMAFRIVDITKLCPIKWMEKLPGGFGIMADDLLGGVIVNLLLRLFSWLFFTGGIFIIRNEILSLF